MARFSKQLKPGNWVRILFSDHTENISCTELRKCIVSGRVHRLHRDYVVVDGWANEDPDCEERGDGMVTSWVVIRSTIINVDIMIPEIGDSHGKR